MTPHQDNHLRIAHLLLEAARDATDMIFLIDGYAIQGIIIELALPDDLYDAYFRDENSPTADNGELVAFKSSNGCFIIRGKFLTGIIDNKKIVDREVIISPHSTISIIKPITAYWRDGFQPE